MPTAPPWWSDTVGFWRDDVLKGLIKFGVQVVVGIYVAVIFGLIEPTDQRATALGIFACVICGAAGIGLFLAARWDSSTASVVAIVFVIVLAGTAGVELSPPGPWLSWLGGFYILVGILTFIQYLVHWHRQGRPVHMLVAAVVGGLVGLGLVFLIIWLLQVAVGT